MATGTTKEAMALLKKYRAEQIDDAREVACELIERFGYTSSRQVQEAMAALNLIDPHLGNFWLGAVFNDPQFAWTGKWEIPEDVELLATKNKAHAWRPIKIWTFKTKQGYYVTGANPTVLQLPAPETGTTGSQQRVLGDGASPVQQAAGKPGAHGGTEEAA